MRGVALEATSRVQAAACVLNDGSKIRMPGSAD
jgi:hypothetical protein